MINYIKEKIMNVINLKTKEPLDQNEYFKNLEIDVLARTIYGEVTEMKREQMLAIGNVVMNRAKISEKKGRYWWGNSIIGVCQKPYQFSCWNRLSPSYQHLMDVDQFNDEEFIDCLSVAKDLINRKVKDNTNGATHYHLDHNSPYWSKGEVMCKKIDNICLYALVSV